MQIVHDTFVLVQSVAASVQKSQQLSTSSVVGKLQRIHICQEETLAQSSRHKLRLWAKRKEN